VHLQGSLDGGTTWLPLAAAQGAAGRTELKLDVLAPTRLLVRVLARDRAGNAAMADLGEAVFTPPLPLDAIPDLLERLDSRRVRLGWHARPDGVPASRYAQLELWRSLDRGQTWALSRANEAAGTWAAGAHADLPEGEGVAWFRLCGITEGGRREAAPAAGDLPELEVAYDTQAPVVKATLEPAGPVFAPGDRPTLLVQAEDTNLDPAGGRVELWTTEGLAATIPLASAGGGAFSAVLDLPGSGGDVRIVAVIRDALGNEGRAECLARLPLLGTLESVGLEGNAPAYTDTRRLVIWRYGNSQGHLGSGGLAWLWAEDRQGKRTLLGAELPDDGDWLWPRLPSAPGEYRLVLETLPPSEARRRSVASEWFNVLRSAPLLELLAPEGPTEETLREYPLRLRLTQDGNSYGIPLARVRVQWRLRGRENWESDAIELVAGPDAWRGELPAVEQRVTFMPFHGEGGYDVRVSAEDIYGNTSPAAEGSVWFDLRRPVAELDVSTAAEGMLRARWSAEDATLDPEGIRLETATGGPEGWGPWQALDLGRSPGGLSRLNGATEFAAPGALTRVRLTVRDRAGRVTMLESSRGAVAGGPGYRAARAVETLPDALAGEAYAGPGYSRRARFDVLIEAEAGFAAEPSGVTLFWRRAGETAWHETPGIGRGVRRVPFAAPASGLYQFVAVARSSDGRTDQPVHRDGDGGMPAFSDSEVEAEIWVDAVTFRVEVATFPSTPVQPDNTRTVLPGTTRAGETAELVFDLLHGLRASELEVQLDLSLDAGQTWAPLAIPRHGVLKEALGAGSDDPYLQRVRWRVPLVMPQQATGCAQVRITALETGRLASGRAVALTPLFEIRNADGTLPKAAPGPLYAARLKAGDAAAAAGDDTEAVKCWLEAMR
ncbi:MAG: hypothetical protein IT463_13370, partial [Planctomycetes bacterium]|nr:hypothetical protein [Planctomycetota bacterium]